MLVLSGGTGGPKLLRGLLSVADEDELTIIVNTGDDIWISGNLVCPDVDTVTYTLARIITDRWWGIRDDTFRTYEELSKRGFREEMIIGDLDRATHIIRTNLMRQGNTLTQATRTICKSFSITSTVLPMTDDFVPTTVLTDRGAMHIQDFLIKYKREPKVLKVDRNKSTMTPEVRAALTRYDSVVIGPSNPISSIGPILSVEGMKRALKDRFVVAISPIIRGEPVSGPARQFMESEGLPVNSSGVARLYEDFLDVFIADTSESNIKAEEWPPGMKIIHRDILMHGIEQSMALAEHVLAVVKQHSA